MRVVIQRAKEANVIVDDKVVGSIGKGIVCFLGVFKEDIERATSKIDKMTTKIMNLRIYEDENDKMNRSLLDISGDILIVSNFTLCADLASGTRPSYSNAAGPNEANAIYEDFIKVMREKTNVKVESGIFGADMEVNVKNDGPVTIVYDL